MSQSNYLIIGQGNIGLPVAEQLAKQGLPVTGLARGERSNYSLSDKVHFIQANARALTTKQLTPFTHIAIIVTPDSYNGDAYKNTYHAITKHLSALSNQLPKLERIVFISSTGVYAQDNGEWIDDTVQPITPQRNSSLFILAAELSLQSAYGKRAVIIRPSGIYGTRRLMRIRKAQEGNKKAIAQYSWTNRIMDSDLVNVIVNVLTVNQSKLKPLYLATDYLPVTAYELTCWLCDKLDLQRPIAVEDNGGNESLDNINNSHAMTGKRLHSNIPLDWLQYADWQTGYSMILQSLNEG